jgi:hypothetical protein
LTDAIAGTAGGRESAVTGVERRAGGVVVSLGGELDLYNAEEVRSAGRALEVSGLDRHFLVSDTLAEALEADR